jgi:hypothetical protein
VNETEGRPLARLTSIATELDADERAVGALLRLAIRRQPISARGLERVRARLAAVQSGAERVRPRGRTAIAAVLALTGTLAVSALAASRLASPWRGAPQLAPVGVPLAPTAARHGIRTPELSRTEVADPVTSPRSFGDSPIVSRPDARDGRDPTAHETPRPFTIRRRVDRVASRTLAGDSTPRGEPASDLTQELNAVERGIQLLRREHDVDGAIAVFRAYLGRFSAGMLRHEVELALAQALLESGRSGEALAVLDEMPAQGGSRGHELAELRAELRANSGRCREAVDDFTRVLNGPADQAREERALIGRARCRRAIGDESGAHSDLIEYLAHFPAGHFATDARRALRW